MRKLFAWGLPDEDQAPPEIRTFTDAKHPGEEFALCLARPGLLEEAAIQEVAEARCEAYLPPKGTPFLSPSGKRYPLNRAAVWEVSAVYCLQGGPVAERYQWEELLAVYLRRGRLWRQASAWAGKLLDEERQSLGGDEPGEPAPSEASSTEPSPDTTSPTPKPSRGKTTSPASSATASAA